MRITIEYDSCWRNAFLGGSNNETVPKKGREFLGSMKSLKKEGNFKVCESTLDTVMGVLNRLIGDQRKLYQARSKTYESTYYFENLEDKVSFMDKPQLTNEITFIRNMTGSFDRESYTGAINTNHWLFKSSFSNELWSLAFTDLKGLISFIVDETEIFVDLEFDPRKIIERFGSFKSINVKKVGELDVSEGGLIKAVEVLHNGKINETLKDTFPSMHKSFSDIEYIKEEKIDIRALYCSALYLKLLRLHLNGVNIESNIKGFSVAGLTPKDFMSCFTQGKKKVYGNPYLKKEKIKGQGEVTSMMTKASGQLEIIIDVDREKGLEIKKLIDNAGVSSFYLGKKGLAYVSRIGL